MQSQQITVSEHILTIYFHVDMFIPECVQFYDIDKAFIHYKSKKKELIPTRKQIYCISDCLKKQIKSKEYDNKQSIPNEALENALGKLAGDEMREIKTCETCKYQNTPAEDQPCSKCYNEFAGLMFDPTNYEASKSEAKHATI